MTASHSSRVKLALCSRGQRRWRSARWISRARSSRPRLVLTSFLLSSSFRSGHRPEAIFLFSSTSSSSPPCHFETPTGQTSRLFRFLSVSLYELQQAHRATRTIPRLEVPDASSLWVAFSKSPCASSNFDTQRESPRNSCLPRQEDIPLLRSGGFIPLYFGSRLCKVVVHDFGGWGGWARADNLPRISCLLQPCSRWLVARWLCGRVDRWLLWATSFKGLVLCVGLSSALLRDSPPVASGPVFSVWR